MIRELPASPGLRRWIRQRGALSSRRPMEDVLAPGTRLGRYEIVSRLAMGGMAEIYLARMSGPAGFAKHVVLKRILPGHARNADFIRMFHNEARYAAVLDHPNIAHVYDLGEDHGLHYFTMEYLHGDDCRALVRAAVSRGQRIPLEHALAIVIGAANGCHYAHEMTGEDGRPLGLVHRDISPSNVVVTYAGAVKIVDFGIAKATNIEAVTAAGGTKGKLAYMAPEQGRSQPLDRRADVYALGVLLYELTTLRRAFVGEVDAQVLWLVMTGEWQRPSEVVADYPPALEAIIVKAMQVDREERYATARQLQHALEAYAREAGLSMSPSGLGELLASLVGTKVEPWRLSERTEAFRPAATGSVPFENTALAFGAPRADAAHVDTYVPIGAMRDGADGAAEAEAEADGGTPIATSTAGAEDDRGAPAGAKRPGSGRMVATIAGGVVAAGAVAAGAYGLWRGSRHEEPPVVVIAERGSAVVEAIDAAQAAPATDAAVAAVAAVDAEAPGAIDAGASRRPPRPVKPAAGDPLSQAFARRASRVSACFASNPSTVVSAPELTLRFEIDAAGVPTTVELLPAELARTPLGACVVDVARGTRFPPQGEPLAFHIPVAVRRTGGAP
ncbi:MAG TPA: protein kinase [Kofleriaceae bacterium]|nr:protein kinase [Kofleriaceae bacterium]